MKIATKCVMSCALALSAGCSDRTSPPSAGGAEAMMNPLPSPEGEASAGSPSIPGQMTTPELCEPAPEAVAILPRSSNHEVWQLYSDLATVPVDKALFAQWTPLAQVRGFDHMTESRIDPQTLEEQLRTAEAVAEQLVSDPNLLASCPEPPEQMPLCSLHSSYDASAQFSSQQGADCWYYLDGASNQLVFDAGPQRWMSPAIAGLFIWRTGQHPSGTTDVIRRWQAPTDGAVTLQGSFADGDNGGGDGVTVEVQTGDQVLFQALIQNGGAPVSFELSVNTQRGEFIDFVVKSNGSPSWDSTGLNAT